MARRNGRFGIILNRLIILRLCLLRMGLVGEGDGERAVKE